MPLLACEGCIKDIFVTETEFIDRFTGQELWLWGCGASGVLGNNAITNRSSPVQTVSGGTDWKQASVIAGTSAAIKTDGTLWAWGCNISGQLGTDNRTNVSSPVQTISGGNNWKQVSVGARFSAAIKTDGTLWLWGLNSLGQLGTGDIIDQSSPVQTISSGTNWKSISVGNDTIAGIKTDGTLWLWGNGCRGVLGNNLTNPISSPVQTISGGNNWKQVSVGCRHAGAIKTDGTLWMWGTNLDFFGFYTYALGTLGDDTLILRSSPVQTISGGTNWKQVSAGNFHTAAIKTDGTLWLWGCGGQGELGTNNRVARSSPVQTVSGGTNWKCVSAGLATSAIKTDGTLWLWGNNLSGITGDNTIIFKSSPVQTVTNGTSWRSVCSSLLISSSPGINTIATRVSE
jgi:alpha-tubulin suppressor-like RCC1 family protein